jgi:hypothetical protein
MTDAERSRFAQLLALLGEVFNEPVTAARVTGYCLALDDLPFADVQRGVDAALKECRFFPKPAEIRTLGSAALVDAAWVNRMLSEAISGKDVGPFVGMFVDRLGGIHAVEDRLPNDRLPLVRGMYPGIVAACRARGIPIPTEGTLAGPAERRALEAHALALLEQMNSRDDDDEETG